MRVTTSALAACCLLFATAALGQTQATSADRQWLAEMRKLMKNPSPKAARQRATLAYWTLTAYRGRAERLGIDPSVVRKQGLKDALAAAQGLPDSPGVWKEIAAWRALGPVDAVAAAAVACPAAKGLPRKMDVSELCGDFRRDSGDARGAVRAWRRALADATEREDRLRLIVKIDETSANPDQDLAGVPAGLRQQAHLEEQQQMQARQQAQAQRQAAAQQQAQAAARASSMVQTCLESCAVDSSQCHYENGYTLLDFCDSRQTSCNSQCYLTSGASNPVVVPPAYFDPMPGAYDPSELMVGPGAPGFPW